MFLLISYVDLFFLDNFISSNFCILLRRRKHAEVVSISPANGENYVKSPLEVTITFDTDITVDRSKVVMLWYAMLHSRPDNWLHPHRERSRQFLPRDSGSRHISTQSNARLDQRPDLIVRDSQQAVV